MAKLTRGIDLIQLFESSEDVGTIQEVNVYMLALCSYPDQFADKPHLSFQQHLQNVIQAEHGRLTGILPS
ncbi:MAG: hypothetical protein DMG70_20420 [Acidobacteria bacterium]|nr:MAG: hypothetical protein DMG70_20420 [Acidobacteriota bacterium]PYY11753.1 MAG: hypothetical protein DMG69_03195 [Acidobacteriota bacterium]